MFNTEREDKIKENLGLVYSIANRFKGKGVDFEDLVQIGSVGLIKAVDNFDENLGYSFSTYAVPVILGEIRQYFRDDGTVKVSRAYKELGKKVNSLREDFFSLNGREPTLSELSEKTGASKEDIAVALNAVMPVFSLTVEDEDGQYEFSVPVESYDKRITEKVALSQLIDNLDEIDKLLIKCRYFDEMNQTKTAEIIGTTQVQVSRREKKILSLLRKQLL